ncbi:MAG: ABC transporter ATP-binding protein, partial [Cyanobacteria bacterium]|nr:ABC transporter ATP-binding protein [Cyanobacteriota bacterium]MDW8202029.1 ABC transporter ATP-binding protein [Cyanobacteriota bacterium SKYGB_h_bin112]
NNVTLTLREGELLSLLGASGCGKTTLLRLIAGFEQPDAGTIWLGGELVASAQRLVPPEARNVGIVFQDYALFPHLTVAENIAFGLRSTPGRGKLSFKPAQIRQIVEETIALINLQGMESRYPHQLSGGQQQRVALARALAPRPRLILLDEPFSNLDAQVRQQLRQDVRQILRQTNTTAILVTHDQEEALAVADRVGILHQGRLEQIGTPEDIYQRPASQFVAEFVTKANVLPAQRQDDCWVTELGQFVGQVIGSSAARDGNAIVYQDDLVLDPVDGDHHAVICDRQFMGREYQYTLRTHLGTVITARTPTTQVIPVQATVKVSVRSPRVVIFSS